MPKAKDRPLVIGAPVEGCDGYAPSELLPDVGIRRRWTYNGVVRSVEWREGGVVKMLESFPKHASVDAMQSLLDECAVRGVVRPSSYGDLFHQRIYQPPSRASFRKMFAGGRIPGGWNAIRERMRHRGELFKYDVRSAYLWALAQGLPHPDTFRIVRRVDGPGVYWAPSPNYHFLPHPWNKPGWYPATEEELLALPISISEIKWGVAFTPGTLDTGPWVDDIRQWSCAKVVGQAYWGRWVAGLSAVAETLGNDGELRSARELHDGRKNPIWGALITSRLRLRLWRLWDSGERRIFRVFTDSILTDTEIDTGDEIGDWRLVDHYPDGAIITLQEVKPLPRAA